MCWNLSAVYKYLNGEELLCFAVRALSAWSHCAERALVVFFSGLLLYVCGRVKMCRFAAA